MVMLTQAVVVVKLMVMTRRTFITEWSIRLVMVRMEVAVMDMVLMTVLVVAMVMTKRTFIIEVSTGAWARFCNVLVRVTEA